MDIPKRFLAKDKGCECLEPPAWIDDIRQKAEEGLGLTNHQAHIMRLVFLADPPKRYAEVARDIGASRQWVHLVLNMAIETWGYPPGHRGLIRRWVTETRQGVYGKCRHCRMLAFLFGHCYEREDSDCWGWDGPLTIDYPRGYGSKRTANGKSYRATYAHRQMFELNHGPPDPGYRVAHYCGDKTCLNPEHLAMMTHADLLEHHANIGTYVRGSALRLFTDNEVREIRKLYADGMGPAQIAQMFGDRCGRCSIHRIATGDTYKHVA